MTERRSRGSRWKSIQRTIIECEACPRLRAHCRTIAAKRRPMYADWPYWGRPVPAVGRLPARLFIVGLAPAAHGANRTGRMFTGDSSGDWLYEALHKYGFANQPQSTSVDDGLRITDCIISAAARCAPPQNKPTIDELDRCRGYLLQELELAQPRLILVLGRIGYDTYLKTLEPRGMAVPRPKPSFAHDQLIRLPEGPPVLQSYHPSRQNTNTGRLTQKMWHGVFRRAREYLDQL